MFGILEKSGLNHLQQYTSKDAEVSPLGCSNSLQLCETGITYLDHAAATLYPESLLRDYCQDISRNVYGERVFFGFFFNRNHFIRKQKKQLSLKLPEAIYVNFGSTLEILHLVHSLLI